MAGKEMKWSKEEMQMWMHHKKKKALLLLFVGIVVYLAETKVLPWPAGSVSLALLLFGVLSLLMVLKAKLMPE